MRFIFHIFLIAIIPIIFSSCDNDTNDRNEVEKVTMTEIITIPGFDWLNHESDLYIPDETSLNTIKQLFDPAHYYFYVYAKRACSCDQKHIVFAAVYKTLIDAGISENYFDLYIINDVDDIHPHENRLTIQAIPAFYIVKDNEVIYSVLDSLHNSLFQDTYFGGTTPSFEEVLAMGLAK